MDNAFSRIRSVARKEFRHIFRDKISLMLLFVLPAAIMLIFGYGLRFTISNLQIQVYSPEHSSEAERLFKRLDENPDIRITGRIERFEDIDLAFRRGSNRAVVIYGKDGISLIMDGAPPAIAFHCEAMLMSVIGRSLREEFGLAEPPEVNIRYLYNPTLRSKIMPVPGLIVMIFIMVGAIALASAINKEKNSGTFCFLRMTKLTNLEIISGKSIPYFIICLLNIAIIYLICIKFGIVILGSLALFFALCVLFALCCMSIGLMIASWMDQPQAVIIVCWVAVFIPNVFLSGFVFPTSSMTGIVKSVVDILPGTAFINTFRGIVFRGTGLAENGQWLTVLAVDSVICFILSLIGFRRRAL